MKRIALIFGFVLLFFVGCGSDVYNVQKTAVIPQKLVVIPFANFTQTQMAGYKVAGIAEGVLRSKGYQITQSLWNFPQEEYSLSDINKILNSINNGYVVTGYVNEYRYKTGIDGEPAVSVTVKIYDTRTKKYIYRATFSKVGDTYDSLGVVTQKALNKIFE